jgi:glucose-1-phosphate thymidylyltransferase
MTAHNLLSVVGIAIGGIKEILIISTPEDLPNFKKLLWDGVDLGIQLTYKEQARPEGLAQAFIIGADFIGNAAVCLILRDNIFYGQSFSETLQNAKENIEKGTSTVFGYYVNDPERYGVAEFDSNGIAVSIEEKPARPKSNYAIVGLYFYTNEVVQIEKSITPSPIGELEITDVNQAYLKRNNLKVQLLGRGFTWLDTGSHASLMEAGQFIETIEKRQGLKVACLEEIAFNMKYIDKAQLKKLAEPLKKNEYGQYLLKLAK